MAHNMLDCVGGVNAGCLVLMPRFQKALKGIDNVTERWDDSHVRQGEQPA